MQVPERELRIWLGVGNVLDKERLDTIMLRKDAILIISEIKKLQYKCNDWEKGFLGNFYGHKEKMLAIQLIAIVIMLPGVVWAFLIMPGTWEIPLLFIMVNLVIFVMDAARGRN